MKYRILAKENDIKTVIGDYSSIYPKRIEYEDIKNKTIESFFTDYKYILGLQNISTLKRYVYYNSIDTCRQISKTDKYEIDGKDYNIEDIVYNELLGVWDIKIDYVINEIQDERNDFVKQFYNDFLKYKEGYDKRQQELDESKKNEENDLIYYTLISKSDNKWYQFWK